MSMDTITELLGIPGWEVELNGIEIMDDSVLIKIRPKPGSGHFCECGHGTIFNYDCQPPRRVRDFPVFGRRCWFEFSPVRISCPACGVVVEKLDWLDKNGRQTLRYEKYVASLCNMLPVLDVAELEGLDKNKVYRIDRKWLSLREKKLVNKPVIRLGIDEIAIKKRHKYATVFYDPDRREVIGLVKSRKVKAVNSIFRRMGKSWCNGIEAVCMDLWQPFLKSVRRFCKNAVVVFDKFHVYKYMSSAVDEVRKNEMKNADEQGRKLLKGSRWLWLKKRLTNDRKQTLMEIMELNRNLASAYLLKEDFTRIYLQGSASAAEKFMTEWILRCYESGLAPFIKLAKRITRWKDGILSYFRYRITNGISEGINNKIKVLKRRSYGFHDEDYFFLKILNITGTLPPISSVIH